jgi:hypothetical protein
MSPMPRSTHWPSCSCRRSRSGAAAGCAAVRAAARPEPAVAPHHGGERRRLPGVSLALLSMVLDTGPIDYALGGWEPPIGIGLRVDAMNAFVLVIISGMSTATLLYARRSLEAEIAEADHPLFYTSFLLCLTGLLGITSTGDAFNFFVFLEISSLATYTLVAMGAQRDRRALTAAFRYLVMGTIGATFYLIGVGFLYIITGTLNMADLAERLQDQQRHHRGPGGLCLHHHRPRPQGGRDAPACVAAQRLCLCPDGGDRVPGRDRDQGRGLRPDALPVHRLRPRVQLRGQRPALHLHAAGAVRHVRSLRRGSVAAGPSACWRGPRSPSLATFSSACRWPRRARPALSDPSSICSTTR